MEYDAITLDTTIFDQYQINFEGGLLPMLTQFKEGRIEFIISEIVLREVESHLTAKLKETTSSLSKVVKECRSQKLIPEEVINIISEFVEYNEPEIVAKQRLEEFIEDTRALIIPAVKAKIDELIRMYFEASAPFSLPTKKKYEFPDAIALLSIEKWAEENNKRVLAISSDKGWSAFAENSDRIDLEKDLADALSKFQHSLDQARCLMKDFVKKICAKINPIYSDFTEALKDALFEADANAYAASDFEFGFDQVDLTLIDFQISPDNFKIVNVGHKRIAIILNIVIEAHAGANVSMFVRDSVDKDYILLDQDYVTTEKEFSADLILSCEVKALENDWEYDITRLEFLDDLEEIDFGHINFSHRFYR